VVSPNIGAESAGMIQLLALVVPVVAVAVLASSVPAVRAALSDRIRPVREFFFGPKIDLQAVGADAGLGTSDDDPATQLTDTPVPAWFDPAIFDESDDDAADPGDD
jgi:hypothetical protein